VVVLPGVGLAEAADDAENLRTIIEDYNFIIRDHNGQVLQKGIKITVSIGVAELKKDWADEAGRGSSTRRTRPCTGPKVADETRSAP
jgi:diguanylate cyclase